MRRGDTRLLLLVGLFSPLLSCATAPVTPKPLPAPAAPSRAPAAPTGDLTELALLESGYPEAALPQAKRRLAERLAPVIARASQAEGSEARGRALLSALYADGLLKRYRADASTLKDILQSGDYNCVSSALLYALTADRLGLDVRAELLPTHARALLLLPSDTGPRPVVVETTSPEGFRPSAAVLKQVRAQAVGSQEGRAVVAKGGARVELRGLIATMVVNRGSLAEEANRLTEAEQLYAQAEALAGGALLADVLRAQRAALLSQLAAAEFAAGLRSKTDAPDHLERAFSTLSRAAALKPEPPLSATVEHNLRVVGERLLAAEARRGKLTPLRALGARLEAAPLSPQDRAGLTAHRLSHETRLLAEAGRYAEAVDAVDRARALPLGPKDEPLREVLEQNRVATLRRAAQRAAQRGDYEAALRQLRRAETAAHPDLSRDRRELALVAGAFHLRRGDTEAAAAVYRAGLGLLPNDPKLRQNLLAALSRLALADHCARAQQLLPELRGFGRQGLQIEVRCAREAAERALGRGDPAAATAALERAYKLTPKDRDVRVRLSQVLIAWAGRLARGGECAAAKERLRRADRLGRLSKRERADALGRCR